MERQARVDFFLQGETPILHASEHAARGIPAFFFGYRVESHEWRVAEAKRVSSNFANSMQSERDLGKQPNECAFLMLAAG